MQNEIFQKVKLLDLAFWTHLDTASIQYLESQQLDPSSMSYYGEIIFLLLGLKPCVLFSNFNKHIMQRYIENVLKKSVLELKNIQLDHIKSRISTASSDYSSDTFFLWDIKSKCANVVKDIFLSEKPNHVKESVLANLLDYPASFPEKHEFEKLVSKSVDYKLCEVAYFDVSDKRNRRLITTFAVR